MFHWPAPGHAEEHFRHAPQHAHTEQRGQQPATEVGRQEPGHRQRHQEEAHRERNQAIRQAHPRAFGQPRRRVAPAQIDEGGADKHQHRRQQQGVAEDAVMQAEAVHQDRQQCRQHKAQGRGDVGVGDVFVAGDHVVQVDHIALGHGQQATQQVDLGGTATAPHIHPAQGAEDGEAHRCEQKNRKQGVQHGEAPTDHTGLMWERACSRRRCISHRMYRLTHRFREQARSHIFDRVHIGSVLGQKSLHRRRAS